MDLLKVTRREVIELHTAVNGLARYSTQAGFYIGKNASILNKIAKDHDNFLKTLQQNYATKIGEGENKTVVFEDDNKTPKVEGQNLIDMDRDFEKYLDEVIDVKDLRAFSKNDLKVRVSDKGKTEMVMPDLPGTLLGPCLEHGLITDLD